MKWLREIIETECAGMTPDEIRTWADDLERHGCETGMVGSLLYTRDILAVYEEHENEILSVLEQMGSEEPQFQTLSFIATWRTWAVCEICGPELAREYANELGD